MKTATKDALSLDGVCTIAGTRRWLPPLVEDHDADYWPSFERRKKIPINTPIQGSGADLVIWAVNQFMHELPEGVEIVNLVHDEVDAIVTRETLKATVDLIIRAFQEKFAGFYPSSELVPKIKFYLRSQLGRTFRSMEPGLELFLFQEEGIRFASERDSRAALASASLRTCAVRERSPASFWCI